MNNEDRKEAERIVNRLRSDDPDFDDAEAAANLLERLAAQPAQVPMTKEEQRTICGKMGHRHFPTSAEIIKRVEAHHGIKGEGRKGERKCV